ncbi:16S rRNA (cytosine(1402)-N(4))-methyltransferase RsmH [Patescibacteria group bacterium]|nr:16S rRNA (cytosine(1402)-N(4))-methyltransferase RsmH [Patescibacteria group bacterium]
MKSFSHQPVMVEEILHWLNPKKNGVYVDCTLGAGGHSKALLEKAKGEIRLIGIDRDEQTLRVAKENLGTYRERISFIKGNFKDIFLILKRYKISSVDGILYDLGISSLQLNNPERGFSFRYNSLLDMRVDQSQELTATKLINELSCRELEDIFFKFGEERWARRIAEFIVRQRQAHLLRTTGELVDVIRKAIPGEVRRKKKLHFATKVFQALRIAVNQELDNLTVSLNGAIGALGKKGRICVISYHSLEDRIVKREFKQGEGEKLTILTKKVVRPSNDEIKANSRARSAKLRVAEKL